MATETLYLQVAAKINARANVHGMNWKVPHLDLTENNMSEFKPIKINGMAPNEINQ